MKAAAYCSPCNRNTRRTIISRLFCVATIKCCASFSGKKVHPYKGCSRFCVWLPPASTPRPKAGIYLATLSGVNQSLHEAAAIDGAGRMRRILHVNLPAIMPVIVIQLIMRVGRMMLVGFDKVILLYSPAAYETAVVISSYVYRRGLYDMDYSYGAAVGLFNSVINLMILIGANAFSRRVTGNSLW